MKFIGAATLVAAVIAAVFPWSFSSDRFRRDIALQAGAMTGMNVSLSGHADFAILPRPRVKIEGLHAEDRDGAITIEADYLRGDVRILPLIAGRLELANIALAAPRLEVDVNRLRPPVASFAPTAASGNALPVTPVTISVVNGTAVVHAGGSWRTQLDDLAMSVDWLGPSRPLTGRADMRWRRESARLQFWMGGPRAPGAHGGAPVVVKFDAPSFAASVDGDMGGADHLEFNGAVTAAVASLHDLLTGFADSPPDDSDSPRVALSAVSHLGSDGATLSDVRIDIPGSRFDGALTIVAGAARPMVSGTFATQDFDIAAMAPGQPLPDMMLAGASEPSWVHWLSSVDVDLRLSAARLRAGRIETTGAGLSMISREGRFEATLANAQMYGGEIRGHIAGAPSSEDCDWRADGYFRSVDLGALAVAAHRSLGLTGVADGEFDVATNGFEQAKLLANLSGAWKMSLRKGEIVGVDIEQALRRIERRPLSTAADLRGGRTRFDQASASFAIHQGVATIASLRGAGPAAVFDISGAANMAARELDLKLLAWPNESAAADAASPPRLAISLRGPFSGPSLYLDPQELIERSRAAAPLWDSAAQTLAAPPIASTQAR